jgi:hypothetical protein
MTSRSEVQREGVSTTNRIAHSLEFLRARYHYDPETGLLISRKSKRPVGSISGNKGKVIVLRLNGKQTMYRVHRLAVFLELGIDPIGYVVYHIDGDNCNNRWENLQVDYARNNARNCIHQRRAGRIFGVTWVIDAKRWEARIKVEGVSKYLGRYKRREDAISARTKAEVAYGFNLRHSL